MNASKAASEVGSTQPNGPVAQSTSTGRDDPRSVEEGADGRPTSRKHRDRDGLHTRISRLWSALFVAALFGVATIDFIVQNNRSVRIEFFGARGQIPLDVALLAAVLAGGVVVLAVGMCRTTQLRLSLRHRRSHPKEDRGPAEAG
jgi:uncharacterized integral membrane protein